MFLMLRAPTYLSWNSGEARAMNQRARSSAAWLKSLAVCGLRTPSRCWCTASVADGSGVFTCVRAAVAKLTRSTTVFDEIHDSLFGQPLTSGGSKRLCPMPEPEPAMSFETDEIPMARAAWTMNSVGDLTRLDRKST